LEKTRILDEAINKNLFISAEVSGTPKILSEGVINGHYAWKVQVPILVTYKPANGKTGKETKQSLTVNVIVMRIPNLDNPEEVAINYFAVH